MLGLLVRVKSLLLGQHLAGFTRAPNNKETRSTSPISTLSDFHLPGPDGRAPYERSGTGEQSNALTESLLNRPIRDEKS